MVFILKEESEKSPGIAVFSHKEFKKFSNYKVFNLISKNCPDIFILVFIGEIHLKI